jgi:hypothetical protein
MHVIERARELESVEVERFAPAHVDRAGNAALDLVGEPDLYTSSAATVPAGKSWIWT